MKKNKNGQISLPLKTKIKISSDTYIFRFEFENPEHCLGLPVGKHVMFHAKIGGKDVVRKYTPISQVQDQTYIDFVIKIYRKKVHPEFPEGGLMTQYLESLKLGQKVLMSGPHGRMKYDGFGRFNVLRAPSVNVRKKIGHIAGGTGITPIFQVIQAALKNDDKTTHQLIFGNRTVDDILLKGELQALEQQYPDYFQMWLTVDKEPKEEAKWDQGVGFITKEMI